MKTSARGILIAAAVVWLAAAQTTALAEVPSHERMVELSFKSNKTYANPFIDVDVDVIFTNRTASWRVPAFWSGGQQWTVRFSPPTAGEYVYRLESTDRGNPDLNGHEQRVRIEPYRGNNQLLRHGPFQVSANKRYLEHRDGTPFFWLADTWWTGMSDRISWSDFQQMVADRKAKGFSVIQTVAGMVPYEEVCPVDPGCGNEGGAVWDPEFNSINPRYFDFMDRRIQHLIDAGLAPAIVGGWNKSISQMGLAKMKKHWRYIVARYGAYPVFWIGGGEIFDGPKQDAERYPLFLSGKSGEWSEVVGYLRTVDPYHHPVTVHELNPNTLPLQQDSLIDFHLLHPGHFGWASIGIELTQLNLHYSRTEVTKPLVVGEIGYENFGRAHLQDFQRVAFWLGMLNGAAGHTYGADGLFESYSLDKPFQRKRWSLVDWKEGLAFPGSYQLGLGAKLLRQYPWWQFAPHPEWVVPRGTTLFEPRGEVDHLHMDLIGEWGPYDYPGKPEQTDWVKAGGDFRSHYAAGIPGQVRVVYLPYFGMFTRLNLTILGLEPGVTYRSYFWDPSTGAKIDLGDIRRPDPGKLIYSDAKLACKAKTPITAKAVNEANVRAAVDIRSDADATLVLRYKDADNYVAALYSAKEKQISIKERKQGVDAALKGQSPIPNVGREVRLVAEIHEGAAAVALSDGDKSYASPIVAVDQKEAGGVGLLCGEGGGTHQSFANFEVRNSPERFKDDNLQRDIYDAAGYRGRLGNPANSTSEAGTLWEQYGRSKTLLLDAYQPPRPPFLGDWLLIMEVSTLKVSANPPH